MGLGVEVGAGDVVEGARAAAGGAQPALLPAALRHHRSAEALQRWESPWHVA